MKKTLLLLLLLCSVTTVIYSQCLLKEVPLNDRILSSGLIIEGKVTARQSFWDGNHQMIYTINTLEIYKIFKGSAASSSVNIITEGGAVGQDMIKVEPSLELSIGDIGVFTCNISSTSNLSGYSNSGDLYEAYAASQGFVKYDLNDQTASEVFKKYSNVTTQLYGAIAALLNTPYKEVKTFDIMSGTSNYKMAPSITSFSPATVTSGTKTVLTINGSGFGFPQGSGTVGFKNSDDGGASYINPLASQYVTWTDTQIQVEVPAKAGTGTIQVTQGGTTTSAGTLTVSYAQLNVVSGGTAYKPHHVDDNGSGGYTWQMYTGFDGNASAKASFLRALDSWRCNTSVNWTVGSTTSVNAIASDGTNVVRFDIGAELPAGVLGRCTSYWSACGSPLNWYVTELDIVFDDATTWQYGPTPPSVAEYDFESVALHELGHGHQLGHVINSGAVMHYAIANGASSRVLSTNDKNAGSYVQGQSIVAGPCGPGAMTNYASCIPTTKLMNAYCGGTVTDLNNYIGCDVVSGATNYQFLFTAAGYSQTFSTNSSYNFIKPSSVPGLTYAKTYDVQVKPTVGGVPGNYGTTCQLTTVAIPNTKLKTTYCGITVTDLNTLVGCDVVGGATDYQFLFTAAGYSQTLNSGSAYNFIKLSSVPGITYSKTYNVQVKAIVGGSSGSFATTCQVTTGAMPNTKLKTAYCGITVTDLNTFVGCDAVGGATDYQFLFVSGGFSQTYNTGSAYNFIKLSWVPGLSYATTYDVQVRAIVGGSSGSYGTVCQITSGAGIPNTKLSVSYCGATVVGLNNFVGCDQVGGATDYQFLFTSGGYSQTYNTGSAYNFVKLSTVPGLVTGNTYNVQVKAIVGGNPGAFGATCLLTVNSSRMAQWGAFDPKEGTAIHIYPNPSEGHDMYAVLQPSEDIKGGLTFHIYDLTGRAIYAATYYHDGINSLIIPIDKHLVPGIYFAEMITNDKKMVQKIIVK